MSYGGNGKLNSDIFQNGLKKLKTFRAHTVSKPSKLQRNKQLRRSSITAVITPQHSA